jgi:hypothetical protein
LRAVFKGLSDIVHSDAFVYFDEVDLIVAMRVEPRRAAGLIWGM